MSHCAPFQKASTLIDMQYPLRAYAYSRWAIHVDLIPKDFLEAICVDVMALFKDAKTCLDCSAYIALIRPLNEENQPHMFKVPFEAFKTSNWPQYWLLCYAIITKNEVLVRLLLDNGLYLDESSSMGDPLGLALRHCADSSTYLSTAENPRDLAINREGMAAILIENGCEISRSNFFHAVQRCSEQLLLRILESQPLFTLNDAIKGLSLAVSHARYENADLLFCHLCSDRIILNSKPASRRANTKQAHFYLLLKKSLKFDSSALTKYILQHTPKEAITQINIEGLFLRATVQNRGLISNTALRFRKQWEESIIDDRACEVFLSIYTWVHSLGSSLQRMAETCKRHQPSWYALRTFKPSFIRSYIRVSKDLNEFLDSLCAMNIYSRITRLDFSIKCSPRRPLSACQRLLAYYDLGGHHASNVWSIFWAEVNRKSHLSSEMLEGHNSSLDTQSDLYKLFSIPATDILTNQLDGILTPRRTQRCRIDVQRGMIGPVHTIYPKNDSWATSFFQALDMELLQGLSMEGVTIEVLNDDEACAIPSKLLPINIPGVRARNQGKLLLIGHEFVAIVE